MRRIICAGILCFAILPFASEAFATPIQTAAADIDFGAATFSGAYTVDLVGAGASGFDVQTGATISSSSSGSPGASLTNQIQFSPADFGTASVGTHMTATTAASGLYVMSAAAGANGTLSVTDGAFSISVPYSMTVNATDAAGVCCATDTSVYITVYREGCCGSQGFAFTSNGTRGEGSFSVSGILSLAMTGFENGIYNWGMGVQSDAGNVPEPSSMLFLACGLVLLAGWRLRSACASTLT